MAWDFFNKLKNGIVKVAKGICKVLKPLAQAILPIAKEVVPTIVETAGNAFKPGLGTVAKIGATGLMNGLDNIVNGSDQKQITYNDSGGVQGYKESQAYQGGPTLPHDKALSFKMKEVSPEFVLRAKGFIGKWPRNAF